MMAANKASGPSTATVKRLFAVSGNQCAFPKCQAPLVDPTSGKMCKTPMPLPETDYQVMNTSHNEFFEITQHLSQDTQYYVINATRRLAEVDWITRKLEEQIRAKGAPEVQEGLLSLQWYLLLTCADTLGHIYTTGGVGKRFRGFFAKLSQEAKRNLTDNIFAWKTDLAELDRLAACRRGQSEGVLTGKAESVFAKAHHGIR